MTAISVIGLCGFPVGIVQPHAPPVVIIIEFADCSVRVFDTITMTSAITDQLVYNQHILSTVDIKSRCSTRADNG